MTMLHHPTEDLLLNYAAGSVDEAYGVMVATHLALCPSCRAAVRQAEAIGGELIEQLAPAQIADRVIAGVMARLDETGAAPAPAIRVAAPGAASNIPRPLRDHIAGPVDQCRWQWKGPGVQYASLSIDAGGNKMGLMRIAPGTRMPHHGHSDDELTMVLEGGYSDEFGRYGRGDIEFADVEVCHQPVADADGPCLCLVITRGKLRPTGIIARWLSPFLSF